MRKEGHETFMKQLISGLIVFVSLFAWMPVWAAGAATMEFSQKNLSVSAGETIDVSININPNGEDLDTARSVFTFDPARIKVESVLRVGAFDRSTPGNFIDNKNGKVSWGGFTLEGPVNDPGAFLKVTLRAIQPGGNTILTLTNESKLISDGEEKINAATLGALQIEITEEKQTDPSLSTLTVSSASHPEESGWYAQPNVEFSWVELKGGSEVTAYYYAFDQASNTDPSNYLAATETSRTFEGVQDGVHYFHLKGVQADGKSTKTVHRRIQIDTQKPNPIAITVSHEQLIEGESLWMTFATTDELSGVEQYQVAINGSAYLPQESPLEITDLVPGTYFIRVAALDRAGNVKYQGQSVRVYPKGTELNRTENFDPNSEISALTATEKEATDSSSPNTKLLITLALVVVLGFGIIYAINKRKR